MNSRTLRVGFALIIVAALVAGCASGGPSVTPTPSMAPPTPTPAPTPSATDSTWEVPPSSYLPEVPRVSVQEVKAKLDAGANIVILDTRPVGEYEDAHILGSISMPALDILAMDAPYTALDPYDEIITYCT